MTEQRFDPVGYCISCGETRGMFTDEHIVPYSLGGNIVLPQAACDDCQKKIHEFETHVATVTYISFRSAQRFPSRTKSLVSQLPVEFKVGSTISARLVPIDDVPVPVIIPSFGLPPYLTGSTLFAQLCVLSLDDNRWARIFQHYTQAESVTVTSGGLKLENFVRLIMKIAYGFTWLVDPKCVFSWDGRKNMLSGTFPDFPIFADIFSVPHGFDQDELFRITVFSEIIHGYTELFCQIELLAGVNVPAYVCQIGRSELKHPFGLEFTAHLDVRDMGGMQLRLPPSSHLS